MKIAIIHISDIHLGGGIQNSDSQIDRLVESLRPCGKVSGILVLLTGDLTYSGTSKQFMFLQIYLNSLKNKIQMEFKFDPKFFCVPGNHDIEHSESSPIKQSDLQAIYDGGTYKQQIPYEQRKLKNYYSFTDSFCALSCKDKLLAQEILDVNGYKIEIRMINNSVFSLINENYKGLLFVDVNEFYDCESKGNPNISITMMHHSYNWYTDEIKNEVEELILSRSSLVFVGHEHIQEIKEIKRGNGTSSKIIHGGVFGSKNSWERSEFNLLVLDTEKNQVLQNSLIWNPKFKQYEPIEQNSVPYELAKKKFDNPRLIVQEEFLSELLQNDRGDDLGSLREYFVFPRISKENNTNKRFDDIMTFDSLISELREKKEVVIEGSERSGKTALSKMVFTQLIDAKYRESISACLILSKDDFNQKRVQKIFKTKFIEIYGDCNSSYVYFNQLPKSKKAIIIDGVDYIDETTFIDFKTYIDENFGMKLYFANRLVNFEIKSKIEKAVINEETLFTYRLPMFYTDKKNELLERIISIVNPRLSETKVKSSILEAITTRHRIISSSPDFLIKFILYSIRNTSGMTDYNSNIFSRVFESDITVMLSKKASHKMPVDKMVTILQRLAYKIHFNKHYPIKHNELYEIVYEYMIDNGSDFDILEFRKSLVDVRILEEFDEKYKFIDDNYLAYFVAKEILSHESEQILKDLSYVTKYACFNINSTILLFVFYLCETTGLLMNLLDTTEKYTINWEELQIPENLPAYLKSESIEPIQFSLEDKQKRLDEEREYAVERDRKLDKKEKRVENVYDYDENDANKLYNQLVRSCTLLSILARSLPSFEHKLSRSEKERFVKQIYQLPNKIFLMWAKQVQEIKQPFLIELKENWAQYEHNKEKEFPLDEIEKFFKLESVTLLLNLYSIAAGQATQETTYQFLKNYSDDNPKITYLIEQLLIMERNGNGVVFYKQALNDVKIENEFAKDLILRIIYHAVLHMDDLSTSDSRSLTSKCFPNKSIQKEIFAERDKVYFKRK